MDPVLANLISESRRQNQQIDILDKAVTAYVIKDMPLPPWFNAGGVGCQGCGADPAWEVLVHSIGGCDGEDCDEDGNFVWKGCDRCYKNWKHELTSIIMRLDAHLPVPCPSCLRPLSAVSDIMLRERKL